MKLIGLAALTTLLFSCTSSEKVNELAQCLNEKGATVYGASGCGYCSNLKEDLGESVSLIKYVDCGAEPAKCAEEKIESLPTLILSDGTRITGYRSLERLAEKTGCEW